MREDEHKQIESKPDQPDKERFYCDFTNLLVRELNVEGQHFEHVGQFVRRVMTEEQYEGRIFAADKFSSSYFSQNSIYWQDYKGKCVLNEQASPELKHLTEKMIQMWFNEKTNFITFIFKYSELISPKEELFHYLFKALLKQEKDDHLREEGSPLSDMVRDYGRILSHKMAELLEYYNTKMGRNYKLLTDEPDKFIISTLPLIEHIDNERIISTYLKVVLVAMKFSQPDKLSNQLARALKDTKSLALLPLRVIVAKVKEGRLEFAPSPQDLYKYIRGDEWVEWIETYLGANQKHNSMELLLDEPPFMVDSIASISG